MGATRARLPRHATASQLSSGVFLSTA
jgi:hypothetical protein